MWESSSNWKKCFCRKRPVKKTTPPMSFFHEEIWNLNILVLESSKECWSSWTLANRRTSYLRNIIFWCRTQTDTIQSFTPSFPLHIWDRWHTNESSANSLLDFSKSTLYPSQTCCSSLQSTEENIHCWHSIFWIRKLIKFNKPNVSCKHSRYL